MHDRNLRGLRPPPRATHPRSPRARRLARAPAVWDVASVVRSMEWSACSVGVHGADGDRETRSTRRRRDTDSLILFPCLRLSVLDRVLCPPYPPCSRFRISLPFPDLDEANRPRRAHDRQHTPERAGPRLPAGRTLLAVPRFARAADRGGTGGPQSGIVGGTLRHAEAAVFHLD